MTNKKKFQAPPPKTYLNPNPKFRFQTLDLNCRFIYHCKQILVSRLLRIWGQNDTFTSFHVQLMAKSLCLSPSLCLSVCLSVCLSSLPLSPSLSLSQSVSVCLSACVWFTLIRVGHCSAVIKGRVIIPPVVYAFDET